MLLCALERGERETKTKESLVSGRRWCRVGGTRERYRQEVEGKVTINGSDGFECSCMEGKAIKGW